MVAGLGLQGKNDGGGGRLHGAVSAFGQSSLLFFRLFALDAGLKLAPGVSQEEVRAAMEKHILDRAELMGTYEKKGVRAA